MDWHGFPYLRSFRAHCGKNGWKGANNENKTKQRGGAELVTQERFGILPLQYSFITAKIHYAYRWKGMKFPNVLTQKLVKRTFIKQTMYW